MAPKAKRCTRCDLYRKGKGPEGAADNVDHCRCCSCPGLDCDDHAAGGCQNELSFGTTSTQCRTCQANHKNKRKAAEEHAQQSAQSLVLLANVREVEAGSIKTGPGPELPLRPTSPVTANALVSDKDQLDEAQVTTPPLPLEQPLEQPHDVAPSPDTTGGLPSAPRTLPSLSDLLPWQQRIWQICANTIGGIPGKFLPPGKPCFSNGWLVYSLAYSDWMTWLQALPKTGRRAPTFTTQFPEEAVPDGELTIVVSYSFKTLQMYNKAIIKQHLQPTGTTHRSAPNPNPDSVTPARALSNCTLLY